MTDYIVLDRPATPDEYRALCVAVGWGEIMNFDAAPAALANSLCGVVVQNGGETVGMGRLVGDGAIFYYIQDVAVQPTHQGRGVGRLIIDALLDHIRATAPDQAFVGLFADHGTPPFYERFGFAEHPDAMTGMFQVTPLPPRD